MSRAAVAVAAFGLAGALASLASGANGPPGVARGRSNRPTPTQPAATTSGGDAAKCAACHKTEGWEKVRFNHDPTGFPLRGAHTAVSCNACHTRGFDVPVADTCAGCHRDRHAGEFGAQCEGCHDDRSWRPLFQADAHRRTAFPLVGKHGLIPCEQCHGNMRDKAFTGAPLRCVSCHQRDYDRTRATMVDHATAGFSTECQTCHSTWRFWPARAPAHDTCFRINRGPHHNVRCLGCHTSLPTAAFTGACMTVTFNCTGCHEHSQAKTDPEHPPNIAPGYQYANGRCWDCHLEQRGP